MRAFTASHRRRRLSPLRQLTLCLTAATAIAADPPPVPDPLGLGERLALISLLQDTYGIHPETGETVEQLRQRYAAAWTKAQQQAPAHLEEADRVQRLRQRLVDRYAQNPDPGLDEAGLLALLHRLEAEQQERNQTVVASPDPGPTRNPAPADAPRHAVDAPPHGAVAQARPPAATVPIAVMKRLDFDAQGVAKTFFWNDGTHAMVLVFFGGDDTGAFNGLPEHTWSIISRSKQIHRAVALFGHGNGTGIGWQSIEEHLRAHRDFYETVGGQLPAEKVECMLFASCSAQNPEQMGAMRDGIGYYPIWKIAAGSREYMNGPVFIAALQAIVDLPPSSGFRGFFRYGPPEKTVSSIGQVGIDGERGNTTKWNVEISPGGALVTTPIP